MAGRLLSLLVSCLSFELLIEVVPILLLVSRPVYSIQRLKVVRSGVLDGSGGSWRANPLALFFSKAARYVCV